MKITKMILLGFIIILLLSASIIGFLIYKVKDTGKIVEDLYNTMLVSNSSLQAEVDIRDLNDAAVYFSSTIDTTEESELVMGIKVNYHRQRRWLVYCSERYPIINFIYSNKSIC